MTKSYELPNGHIMIADFDENGICKVTLQALDSIVEKLNYYADKCEECDNDFEHCAYIECPKEPCDDVVSRQAVLDELTFIGGDIEPDDLTCLFRDRIKQLPSVRPQEQTGHWIENKGQDKRDKFYTCSECGRTINVICGETLKNYPYCHCGARMFEPTCNTCEYNTATFMPCNACEDKSEYEPQERGGEE